MKACERTSETSHHETYSLICIVAQMALLFCRQRSERSAFRKMNLALYLSFWTAKLVFVTQTTVSFSAVENDRNKRKQEKE